MGDTLYTVNENRLNVKGAARVVDTKTVNRYVVKVEVSGQAKPLFFAFNGIEAEVRSDKVTQILNQRLD